MNSAACRAYLRDLQRFGIKLGLENISTVLASFGHPQRSFPAVHVAGTNGKGSVCAMLAEILSLHDLKVGLYTSPHLVRVEERIRVGGALISSRDFCRLTQKVKLRITRLLARKELEAHPTFFEVLTLIAFLYFREKRIDIAVLEVGMGGRFDATNVVRPLVSVITSISKDHQEHLGRTIGKIAFEKAGIIKPFVSVVCGADGPDVVRVIRERAFEIEAPFINAFDRDHRLISEKKRDHFVFRYSFGGRSFRFSPGLQGEHQGSNAAIAVAAASVLSRMWRPLDKKKIVLGIARARWEGRLEAVSKRPLVLLDGAHNEGGAAALAKYIKDFRAERPVLVFAMMKDKAIRRVVSLLFPLAKKVILTSLPYSRAAAPADIRRLARPFEAKIAEEPSLQAAIELAKAEAGPRGFVLITGSLFLVGAFKKLARSG
ncbi:MAG: folylpolyglutamate synthase/dihydrofolate synthase family protein [Candidatus Aminicenantes bacterium]|nr:folylpolyglutamate synthase/dihydrofolate synthase family protein [Candidatus Aminicenantes bacterium]